MTGQVWAEANAAREPTPRLGTGEDCLVLTTTPCAIAIPALRVEQICDDADWPDAALLPSIEVLAGVLCADADANRRVVVLGGPEGPVGVSIPHALSVLPATQTALLPLPELFGGEVFSGLLLWHEKPRALVIDCDRIRARVLEELLRM